MTDTSSATELLEARIRRLEQFRNWVVTAVVIVLGVLSFLGYGAWSSVSTTVDGLQHDADKIEAAQHLIASQLGDISTEASKRYGEVLTRVDDLRAVASKAKADAEMASQSAGNLAESVGLSRTAAENAETAARDTASLAQQAKEASERAIAALNGIQETQKSLESYLKAAEPKPSQKTSFIVTIDGSNGTFFLEPGGSLVYDRTFTSSQSTATIWVPDGASAIVEISGSNNRISVRQSLQGRVVLEDTGSNNVQSYSQ